MMKSYSQRDPRWATIQIKGSNTTIGQSGCTITCIADLSTVFGDDLTPAQVNEQCIFTKEGRIFWATVNFKHFMFERRTHNNTPTEFAKAIADPNRAVILEVANKSHWVVATKYDYKRQIFYIADPWLGDRATMERYKNNITGAAFFRRKGSAK